MASKVRDYIIYYKKKLQRTTDEDIILNSIQKLSKIPITCDLLQETGIAKIIRNYSKETGQVGDKAKVVYRKWKNVVAESVLNSTKKHSTVVSDDTKKVHSSKDKTKKHHKVPLSKLDHLSNDCPKTNSINCASIDNDRSHNRTKYEIEEVSVKPLYTHGKPENDFHYIDYDPQRNIILDSIPDHPELNLEGSVMKECLEILKHTEHNEKNNGHSLLENPKLESIKSNSHISKAKKIKTDNVQLSAVKSKSCKHELNSKVDKVNKDVKKYEKEKLSSKQVELQPAVPYNKEKYKSEKNKKLDLKQKASLKSKETKSNNSANQLHQKTVKAKSNTKLKLKEKKEFTSSEATFEDCLGFNDIISVQKKKRSTKTVKEKTKIDPILKANLEDTQGKKKLIQEKPPVKNSNTVPNIASTLPHIQPNYKPLPHKTVDFSHGKRKVLTNEDAIKFTSSKKEKTAVYSGRRNRTLAAVPTLFNACTQVLIDNIDFIECLGDIPYFLVKSVLERCTPRQLLNIENYNPSFLDNSQDLWEIHCKRDFHNRAPDENETYRDMYIRLLYEREQKLKTITAHISASMQKSAPTVRKAKLAYVDSVAKPPRDVARKQAKHGTALPVNNPMKAALPARVTSMKPVASTSGVRPVYPDVNPATPTYGVVALKKPKVAPLMAKTLKSLKQCFRR